MNSILSYIIDTLISLDLLVAKERFTKKTKSKIKAKQINLIDLTQKNKSIKMNLQQIQEFCESKPLSEATFPFDSDTLAYKVAGRIFALISLTNWENGNPFINLKCDPDYALELRAEYANIMPGYHSSKKHWNSIYLKNNTIPPKLLLELITLSYDLVVKGLPKKVRIEFGL